MNEKKNKQQLSQDLQKREAPARARQQLLYKTRELEKAEAVKKLSMTADQEIVHLNRQIAQKKLYVPPSKDSIIPRVVPPKNGRILKANTAPIVEVMKILGLEIKRPECPGCSRVRGISDFWGVNVVKDKFMNCVKCHAEDCGEVYKPVRLVMHYEDITEEDAITWIADNFFDGDLDNKL